VRTTGTFYEVDNLPDLRAPIPKTICMPVSPDYAVMNRKSKNS